MTQHTTQPETHNTTLHDHYRKECARLFTPGTSTIGTIREIRSV